MKKEREYRSKSFKDDNSGYVWVFQNPTGMPFLDCNFFTGGSIKDVEKQLRLLTQALKLAKLWAKG